MTTKASRSRHQRRFARPLYADADGAQQRVVCPAEATETESEPARGPSSARRKPVLVLERPASDAAVLRGGRGAVTLTAATSGSQFHIELRLKRRVLLSGFWKACFRRNGQVLSPVSEWQTVLRHCDADGDYLELELVLEEQVRLQRHIFLPRRDRFAFLADAVIADQPAQLQYQASWQVGRKVRLEPAGESWECYLRLRKRRAVVLPLALPEWRCQTERGQLLAADAALVLSQTCNGCRLLAPLFVDLKRRRFRRCLTWRQLTVGEALSAQHDDVAVAYRVAVGRRQWLIYRALSGCASRTVLGHHLVSEFLLARFYRSGKVEPLIEISPADDE